MYSPLSLVMEDRDVPVAGTVTVTFAPGTADPVMSVTVPEMLPVACPYSNGPPRTVSKPTKTPMGCNLVSIIPFVAERTKFSRQTSSEKPRRLCQFCPFSIVCQGKTSLL
jgi:hypothetical protein